MESSDKSVQSAIETISNDLETTQSQGKKDVPKDFKSDSKTEINQVVEVLKDRAQELQRDKERLEEKNDTLEQRLLTGEVEEKNKTEDEKSYTRKK